MTTLNNPIAVVEGAKQHDISCFQDVIGRPNEISGGGFNQFEAYVEDKLDHFPKDVAT